MKLTCCVAILHTWSRVLIDHFLIHCLVPAGVLSFDGRRWIESKDNFLFRTESLAKEFKKNCLAMWFYEDQILRISG